MRRAARSGFINRWMALAAMTCLVGCTSPSSPAPDFADQSLGSDVQGADDPDASGPPAEPAAKPDAEIAPVEEVAVIAEAEEDVASPSGDAPEPDADEAELREVAKPAIEEYAANVPRVLLSAAHAQMCKIGVGDVLPTIELPQLSGESAKLESLAGAKATVVLFWAPDRWMAASAMRDLMRDAVGSFPAKDVAVVGIAVATAAGDAEQAIAAAGAKFPQLVDAEGAALAEVGHGALPRVYVLDGQRRIAWFDIEYSESTRRELQQTLAALTGAAQ